MCVGNEAFSETGIKGVNPVCSDSVHYQGKQNIWDIQENYQSGLHIFHSILDYFAA